MCGRYVTPEEAAIERRWHVGRSGGSGNPFRQRFNVAPQQGNPANYVPVVRHAAGGEGLELLPMQWWLLPRWSKEARIKYSTFNARVESVATAASFRDSFRRRRCLLPVAGWYEWQELPPGKRPWFFHAAHDEPVAFAGLWDRWERDGEVIESCTIVVGDPNEAVRKVHDRMPFIIPPEREMAWLDPRLTDADKVMALLQPTPDEAILFHRVSTRVNSARIDDPALMQAVEE